MKLKHLLLGALLTGAASMSAATFDWTPTGVQPSGETTVTQIEGFFGVASNVSFYCWNPSGVKMTDVMPMWIDEDGNEIVATEGDKDFLDPKFSYYFNPDDFQINGEYMLVFPQGLLVNADGDESAEKILYYTFEVESLNSSMFPDFEVLDMTPDFSNPQALWNEQEIVINTNHNAAIGYTVLVVTDLNPDTPEDAFVLESTNYNSENLRRLGNPDPIKWTVANPGAPYKFYEGHTYKAVFTLYNGEAERTADGIPTPIVEKLVYTFTGKIEPYKYSDLVLESYTPEEGTVLNEESQCIFTYTFSGPVNLYKVTIPNGPAGEISVPSTYITSNEDKTVYTIDLRKDFSIFSDAAGYVYLNIYAKDEDGCELVYYKNEDGELERGMGYDDGAHFQFGWFNAIPLPKLVITPEYGAQLNSLTEVRVKFENGQTFSANAVQGFIQTKTGTVVGYLVEPEKSIDVTEMVFTQWKKTMYGQPEPINLTAPGAYAVGFNEGSFIQGEQYDSKVSAPKFNAFTIVGSAQERRDTLVPVSADPENYSYIDSFVEAYITFPEIVQVVKYDGAYMLDQYGQKVCDLTIEGVYEVGEGNKINVFPANDITEAGTYRMVITEGTVGNVDYYESNGEMGIYNPELVYEYIVTGGGSGEGMQLVSIDPAEGTVTELSEIEAYFNQPLDVLNTQGEILDANGEFYASTYMMFDWDDLLLLHITVSPAITADGTYYLHIPAGSIVGLYDYSIECDDIYVTYTIGETAVETVAAAGNATVCDLQGRVILRDASAAQIAKLAKGVYIIDGKKVVK